MSVILISEIVLILKEKYPNHIIMFDCDKGDDPQEPVFHKFTSVDEIINYFNKRYCNPFVIDNNIGDRYTKENCIITFDDEDTSLELTYYKNDYTYCKIYNDEAYLEIKKGLTENSITYDEFES